MNRGANHADIFYDARDRRRFLRLLAESRRRHGLTVHAYCLMGNHYHLLVEDRDGRLSAAMRHINGSYTQAFNRRHGRDGPLFRGRFRAQIVEREGYVLELLRYIHMNPVRAGMVRRAGDYPWSSHAFYQQARATTWLSIDVLGEEFRGTTGGPAERLDAFVHERREEGRNALDVTGPIVGSPRFVGHCQQRVRDRPKRAHPEIPEGARLARLSLDEVLAAAASCLGRPPETVATGCRGAPDEERLFWIYICHRFSPCNNTELARFFQVKPSSIPALSRRGERLPRKSAAWEALQRRTVAALDRAACTSEAKAVS